MAVMAMRMAIALVLVVTVLTGCGRAEATAPTPPPLGDVVSTETFARPATIDIAYLEGVLVELERVRADVRNDVYTTHSMSQQSVDRLKSIYSPTVAPEVLRIFSEASTQEFPDALGGVEKMTIDKIYFASPDCVALSVHDDLSAVTRNPPPPVSFRVELISNPGDNSPNRSPWKFLSVGSDDGPAPTQC